MHFWWSCRSSNGDVLSEVDQYTTSGNIEIFHHYATNIAKNGMIVRMQLAILDYNARVTLQQTDTKDRENG